jgi:hypothetical protein
VGYGVVYTSLLRLHGVIIQKTTDLTHTVVKTSYFPVSNTVYSKKYARV